VSRSIRAEQQIEFSPYNHHLETFLSFLRKERGFADATIVNRKRSLKPFLAWLVGRGVPLSTVSPVVITKYGPRSWRTKTGLPPQQAAG